MISLKVRDVMTQEVVTVEPETPLKDVARLMRSAARMVSRDVHWRGCSANRRPPSATWSRSRRWPPATP
jgi:CBS domain-containing protein